MRILYGGLICFALILNQPLVAGPIQYIEAGQLSGTLGSTSLTDVSFTFTFDGDTLNIGTLGPDDFGNPTISNTVEIGASDGFFTTAVSVGVNDNFGIIGFGDTAEFVSGITFSNAGADSYDLTTSIGPLTSASALFAQGSLVTNLGLLEITDASNLSFQATLADSAPEPATIELSALALLGAMLMGAWKAGRRDSLR